MKKLVLLLFACACACAATPKKPAVSTMADGESITIRGAVADPDAVIALVRGARYVFLGELHDNPRHHQLQADMVRAILETGRAPALAFEMLDVDQMMAVKTARDPRTFGQVTQWEARGWPAYSMYEPMIVLAMERRLPIVPTNLAGKDLMAAVAKGETPAGMGFHTPLDAGTRSAMAADIKEAHCGHATDAMADNMLQAQELRNAYMAQRMLAAATPGGTALIAGGEHARRDHGAPFYLAQAPGVDVASVVTVGFVETDTTVPDGAYDVVWRTPPIKRPDPCVAFEGELKTIPK
jgi:uncharacterized iron-regulated protein